jgi:hypothetical protein
VDAGGRGFLWLRCGGSTVVFTFSAVRKPVANDPSLCTVQHEGRTCLLRVKFKSSGIRFQAVCGAHPWSVGEVSRAISGLQVASGELADLAGVHGWFWAGQAVSGARVHSHHYVGEAWGPQGPPQPEKGGKGWAPLLHGLCSAASRRRSGYSLP